MTITTNGNGDAREVIQDGVDDSVTDGAIFSELTTAFGNNSFESLGGVNNDPNKIIRAIIWDIRKFLISGDLNIVVPRTMSLSMLINGYTIFLKDEFRIDGNLNLEGHFKDNADPLDSANYNLIVQTMRISDSNFKQAQGATYFGSGDTRLANCIYRIGSPINAFSNPNGTVTLDRVWLQSADRTHTDANTDSGNVYNRSKKNGLLRNVISSIPLTLFTVPVIENLTLLGDGVAKLIVNGIDRFGTGDVALVDGINTIGDVSVESTGSPRISIINSKLGSATPITTVGHPYEKQAGVPFYQDVQFYLKDLDGNPIEGGVVRLIQKKTGLETEFLSYCTDRVAQIYDKYDETTDDQIIYEWVSGADGYTNTVRVRLGYEWWNYYVNSNANNEISEGQKKVQQMVDALDNAQFGAYLVGNKIDFNLEQLREYNATKLIEGQAIPILQYEHTEAEIAAFTHYDTTIKLFEGLRYWEKSNKEIIRYIGATNSLIDISDNVVTIRSGWSLKFVSGNGDILVDNENMLIVVPVGDGAFTGDYRLVVDGDFIKAGIDVRLIYEYVNNSGKLITSHHIYPTTDLDVITYNNKQNIHIHAKHRIYTRLTNVTVFGKNGDQIVTNASFPSADISVGDVASNTNNGSDLGVKITARSSANQINSFSVEDASRFSAGDKIYVSAPTDIGSENLLELEDQIGQISHYFEYERAGYFDIELDIFGDIRRSINVYAELHDEINPIIEVIAGAAEIGVWRAERANGVTVSLSADDITLSGDWLNKSPEQLLWNVRESITEWNKNHPNQADKRYEIDYFETTGTLIIWHKEITDLSGFYTTKTDIYNGFTYVDANANLLLIDVGLETETVSQYGMRIKNVAVGDKIGYLVNDEAMFIILDATNVSVTGETVLVLDKGGSYKMRIRRRGFNEPLIEVDDTVRSVAALFISIPNVAYEGTFSGVISDVFSWDDVDDRLIFLQSIDTNVQNNIDALWEYNYLFPQGILGESIFNVDYGFLENVLTLNYKTLVNSHIEKKTDHKDAVYEALAIQSGHNADGSAKYSYLTSAEIDPLNAETFVVHYHHNYENTVSTTGTKALLETPTLTNNVEVLLNEDESHIVNEVIPLILDILDSRQDGANSGTLTFNQGVPIQLPYNKIYRLFHKVSDAEDTILEVVVYSFIRLKVQIRSLNDDGSFTDADDHITWGVHETLQGGFTDKAKEELEEVYNDVDKIDANVDNVVKTTSKTIDIISHRTGADTEKLIDNLEFPRYDQIPFNITVSGYNFYKNIILDGRTKELLFVVELRQNEDFDDVGTGYLKPVLRHLQWNIDPDEDSGVILPEGDLGAIESIGLNRDVTKLPLNSDGSHYLMVVTIDVRGLVGLKAVGFESELHNDTPTNHLALDVINYLEYPKAERGLIVRGGNGDVTYSRNAIRWKIDAVAKEGVREVIDMLSNNEFGLNALQVLIKAIPVNAIADIAEAVKALMEADGSKLTAIHKMSYGDIVFTEEGDRVNISYDGVIIATYDGITVSAYDPLKWAGGRTKI